jgi:PAS domain S-box-containing protein
MQANRLCAEMFGYTLDEFLGQPALILYESAEAYSALGREAGPVLSRGESFKAETRLKRRDGSLFWCRVSAKAVDPEHPRDGTLWIIEDITEDRSMLEALAQQHQRALGDLQFRRAGHRGRAQGRLRALQPRLEEMLGLPAGSLAGQATRRFFNSDEEFQRIDAQI